MSEPNYYTDLTAAWRLFVDASIKYAIAKQEWDDTPSPDHAAQIRIRTLRRERDRAFGIYHDEYLAELERQKKEVRMLREQAI